MALIPRFLWLLVGVPLLGPSGPRGTRPRSVPKLLDAPASLPVQSARAVGVAERFCPDLVPPAKFSSPPQAGTRRVVGWPLLAWGMAPFQVRAVLQRSGWPHAVRCFAKTAEPYMEARGKLKLLRSGSVVWRAVLYFSGPPPRLSQVLLQLPDMKKETVAALESTVTRRLGVAPRVSRTKQGRSLIWTKLGTQVTLRAIRADKKIQVYVSLSPVAGRTGHGP